MADSITLKICPHFFYQKHLGTAIISANCHLTVLDLSDNAFGPRGVEGLVDLLQSSSCFSLRELLLNNNGLGIGGGKVSEFCLALKSDSFISC